MTITLTDFDYTKTYDDADILGEAKLDASLNSVETYINDTVNSAILQLAKDIFNTATYSFNGTGDASLAEPITESFPYKDGDETITGDWTFEGSVSFQENLITNGTLGADLQQRVRATLTTTAQSIPDATITAINFNTEDFDVGDLHDLTTNTNRITIPTGGTGRYTIKAQVRFDNNSTGRRVVYLYKNASEVARANLFTAHATEDTYLQIAYDDQASAGDYYDVRVFQNSGGALDVVAGATSTFFSVMRIP
jgi:hypothetical protein